MIAALDVRYDDATRTGLGAAVVFQHWEDPIPAREYTTLVSDIQPYVPGEFFKRELPCLLALLEQVLEPLDLIIVDGFVSLGDRPGLGMRLWEALDRKAPVVGVAKTGFRFATPVSVVRGTSQRPIFVTAVGLAPTLAAEYVGRMHGEHRIPTMLKRVDRLTRDG